MARLVAVKLIASPRGDTAIPPDRFIQEARAASALKHPNIVTIHKVIHSS